MIDKYKLKQRTVVFLEYFNDIEYKIDESREFIF